MSDPPDPIDPPRAREALVPLEDEELLPPDTTLLDVLDNVLSKGVVLQGEIMIGLAGIDLVFVGVTAIVCSADRVRGPGGTRSERE